jgi:membrane-associated phospholipid phosphatase
VNARDPPDGPHRKTQPAPLGSSASLSRWGSVFLVAAMLFVAMAEDVVTRDGITLLDMRVAQWLYTNATPAVVRFMRVVSDVHGTVPISVLVAAIGVLLAVRRELERLIMLLAVVAGGMLLNVLMKQVFQRARPSFDEPILVLNTYSFPSGHAAASTLLYGLFVFWVFSVTRRPFWRALSIAGAVAMVALVAFSRMLLGVHYLSDVLGAVCEGIAWLALCVAALLVYRRHAFRRRD